MNIFVAIMLGFAALGLFDKMIGGRMGLEKEFDQGMETAGAWRCPRSASTAWVSPMCRITRSPSLLPARGCRLTRRW